MKRSLSKANRAAAARGGGAENLSSQASSVGAVPAKPAAAAPKAVLPLPSAPPAPAGPLAGVRACFVLADAMQLFEVADTFKSLGGTMRKVEDMASATHLIWSGGNPEVYFQAQEMGLLIVSPNWIDMCRDSGVLMNPKYAPPTPPSAPMASPAVPSAAGLMRSLGDSFESAAVPPPQAPAFEGPAAADEERPEEAVVDEGEGEGEGEGGEEDEDDESEKEDDLLSEGSVGGGDFEDGGDEADSGGDDEPTY